MIASGQKVVTWPASRQTCVPAFKRRACF